MAQRHESESPSSIWRDGNLSNTLNNLLMQRIKGPWVSPGAERNTKEHKLKLTCKRQVPVLVLQRLKLQGHGGVDYKILRYYHVCSASCCLPELAHRLLFITETLPELTCNIWFNISWMLGRENNYLSVNNIQSCIQSSAGHEKKWEISTIIFWSFSFMLLGKAQFVSCLPGNYFDKLNLDIWK